MPSKSIIEEWKDYKAEGLDTELMVSNLGRVRVVSYMRFLGKYGVYQRVYRDRILSPSDNGNGYKYITVTQNGKRKHLYVHRLVADLFIPKIDGKDVVNHLDYDRGNNRVDNLEWCTQKENTRYSAWKFAHPQKQFSKMGKYGRGIRLKKGKYEVLVYHDHKQWYAGRFLTLKEAESARNKKMEELGILEDFIKINNMQR